MQLRNLTPIRSTRFLPLLGATVLLACLPSAAFAAKLDIPKRCYPNGQTISMSGEGFAPDSPISFTVNRKAVDATVTTRADGSFKAEYEPPSATTQRRLVIRATDSEGTTAKRVLYVTRELGVSAKPNTTDNVRTWRAVFKLFGFGRGYAYIHYVNPKGKLRKTVRLGKLRGPCGKLKTDKRRVLPVRRPAYGTWKLQFDTHRRYSTNRAKRRVIPVKVFRA